MKRIGQAAAGGPKSRLVGKVGSSEDIFDVFSHQVDDVGFWESFADRPEGGRGHDDVADPVGHEDEDSFGLGWMQPFTHKGSLIRGLCAYNMEWQPSGLPIVNGRKIGNMDRR